MKNKAFYFILLVSLISCKDNNPVGDDDTLTVLNPSKSISILSISADKGLVSGTYSAQNMATFVKSQNPDVVAMQDVDYRTTDIGGKDLISEVAFLTSNVNQHYQGTFTPINKVNGGERGLGLVVKENFNGTQRILLDAVLIMHTMNYTLKSGDKIMIATCQFDKTDKDIMLKQANALAAYGDTVKSNVVVAASIHDNVGSDVLNVIQNKFKRSCRFNTENTFPASQPTNRFDYILTPVSQNWKTQIVTVVGDASVSDHKGVLIRLGFK